MAKRIAVDIRELLERPLRPIVQEYVDNNASGRLHAADGNVSEWAVAMDSATYLMAFIADCAHRDPQFGRCGAVHARLGLQGAHGTVRTLRKLCVPQFSTRHFADGWMIRQAIEEQQSLRLFSRRWRAAHPTAHLLNAQSMREMLRNVREARSIVKYLAFGLPFAE